MRGYKETLVVSAAIATLTMAYTGQAWAGENATSTTADDGASVTFHHKGDYFEVCDLKEDGGTAYVSYTYDTSDGRTKGKHFNPGDAGSCHSFDHDFAEGNGGVAFHACEEHISWPDDCGTWIGAIA